MTIKKVTALFSLMGIIAFSFLFMSLINRSPKTGYVNLTKVFEEFTGKKELENKLQQETRGNQMYLDSLSIQVEGLTNEALKNPANQKLQQKLREKQEALATTKIRIDQYTANRHQQLTEQVWAQINQYVRDFGEEKEYDYIFGADGAGTLMYGSSNKDLSKIIIQYINQKYEGH